MSDGKVEDLENRVLLLPPTARDAVASKSLLADAGICCLVCATIEEVCREANRGAGAAIVTAEGVLADTEDRLAGFLAGQPQWSDLPFIVLTPQGADSPRMLRALETVGPMTLMKRPLQVSTFVSSVSSALRDRRRQYAVRDLLAEREKAAEVLRVERERYQVTLSSIGDAVIATDTKGCVTFLNPIAQELTRWDMDSARGRPLEEVFRIVNETTRQPVESPAIRALLDGTVVGLTNHAVLIARDGTECPLDDSAAPIRGAGGEIVGSVLVFRDITEKKRVENELREADRKKDDFIALLAHELRNPLAPIRNGLHVIRLASEGGVEPLVRARDMMERQLTHMVRMIDDLLDVSRIGRNKMELRRKKVSVGDVIANAVETARPFIEDAGHELIISMTPCPVFLFADLTRLSQVFSNLLTNSAKYTHRGGRIWLTAELGDDEVIVWVRDNGIGIPARSLPTIFDMFSQVDRPIERDTGGLGIGLALVKGLVEMHGGTVSVACEGPGQGSTFTVKLPSMKEESEPVVVATVDAGSPETGSKRRVLVVDDNRDGADSLAMMLEMLGDEVATANNGLEAVEQAERFRPDVILMDVGMPKLNGLDAARRIRMHPWGRGMTIVALTGWGQDSDRDRTREAGCDGHLVKPVNFKDLQKMLAELKLKRG